MNTQPEMPFIPEFQKADERNKWIKDNASYFTVIKRKGRRYIREEQPTFDLAVQLAQKRLEQDSDSRYMIYAVYRQSDTLVATVSSDGVKEHS